MQSRSAPHQCNAREGGRGHSREITRVDARRSVSLVYIASAKPATVREKIKEIKALLIRQEKTMIRGATGWKNPAAPWVFLVTVATSRVFKRRKEAIFEEAHPSLVQSI